MFRVAVIYVFCLSIRSFRRGKLKVESAFHFHCESHEVNGKWKRSIPQFHLTVCVLYKWKMLKLLVSMSLLLSSFMSVRIPVPLCSIGHLVWYVCRGVCCFCVSPCVHFWNLLTKFARIQIPKLSLFINILYFVFSISSFRKLLHEFFVVDDAGWKKRKKIASQNYVFVDRISKDKLRRVAHILFVFFFWVCVCFLFFLFVKTSEWFFFRRCCCCLLPYRLHTTFVLFRFT